MRKHKDGEQHNNEGRGKGGVFCDNNLPKTTMMTNDREKSKKTQGWGVKRKGVVFSGVHL